MSPTRKKTVVALTILALLALTVPWFFIGAEPGSRGLPTWAVYIMAMNVLFPIASAILLAKYWSLFEAGDE